MHALLSASAAGGIGRHRTTVILAAALVAAPSLGSPIAEIFQGTLKFAIWSFSAIVAAMVFIWHQSERPLVYWHAMLAAPLALATYALVSSFWGDMALALPQVKSWLVFAIAAALVANIASPSRLLLLAGAIFTGAVIASVWAVLQFVSGMELFAQGPAHPASTFTNRNFFAEYAVSALPFGMLLLRTVRSSVSSTAVAAGMGLVTVAILMTGMRTALIVLLLQLVLVYPLLAWRFWQSWPRWSRAQALAAAGAFTGVVALLGTLPCGDDQILAENRGSTAIERAYVRSASITPSDGSLSLRVIMWRSTAQMIAEHPLRGVGAGSWQVHSPRYLPDGSQLEVDLYAHNEYLQMAAEYGIPAALIFLVGIFTWLSRGAVRTWRQATPSSAAPARAAAFTSAGSILLVSGAGFALHQPCTAALLAVCFGILAGTENFGVLGLTVCRWRESWRLPALVACAISVGAFTISAQQSMLAEAKFVRAYRLALYLNEEPARPGDQGWEQVTAPIRHEIRRLATEAASIDPHSRQIAPALGEEMAKYGDWESALGLWRGVLQSHPYVPVILTNAARASIALGRREDAHDLLRRAVAVAPRAPAVLALSVAMLADAGDRAQALAVARSAVSDGRADLDLLSNTIVLSELQGDPALRDRAASLLRMQHPNALADAYMQLASLYVTQRDTERAHAAWRIALQSDPSESTRRTALALLEARDSQAARNHQ